MSGTTTEIAVNWSAWHAIVSAGLVVQLTLFTLIGMSIFSWATSYFKHQQFARTTAANETFLKFFWQASSLDIIHDKLGELPSCSLARIFKAGYVELQKIADARKGHHDSGDSEAPLLLSGSDNFQRSLQKATESEIALLENQLNTLATVGSTAPFIGLFGTVWGIMGAFQKIGSAKSASLAVVAPGISEALIATAIGLAAAIPAVMAYNHFIGRLRREELALNGFVSDYTNIVKRNFFKDE